MKVIALEEHFTTRALMEANSEHPLLVMHSVVEKGPATGPAEIPLQLTDVERHRLAVMDAAGIDMQVLSHTPPGPEELPADTSVRLAAQVNDAMAEAVSSHPDRFAAFAALPMPDPGAAAKELERAVRDLGFVGTMIHGHVGGRYLDDPVFRPVLETAETLEVPIFLHPTRPPQAVVDAYYSGLPRVVGETLATAGWGWHIDTGLHVLRLILAGVFDRHPRLQMIIGHLGEALPGMLWRSDSVLNRVAGLDRPVRDYFREHFSLAISGILDTVAFNAAFDTVGSERMLFAVDYPFHSSTETRAFFDDLPLSTTDREKIAHTNAERLLKLTV
ncbi:amidohydrolase family protein [Streptomyces sp. T028]|uniref:amidohydrolase family protein n=1 Tax=Streptomyces sp. T028 TaxID=3394379 RepID=UPI003A8795B4